MEKNIFTVEEWKEIEDMQKKAQKKIEERERENKKRFVKRLRLKAKIKEDIFDLLVACFVFFGLPWMIVLLHVLIYC